MSRAQSIMDQATALSAKKRGILGIFSKPDYFQAAELFSKAGTGFLTENQPRKAAEAFQNAHLCSEKCSDSEYDSAKHLAASGNALAMIDPTSAAPVLTKAAKLYAEHGVFRQAGNLHVTVANAAENRGDNNGALEALEKAADVFKLDNHSKSLLRTTRARIAEIQANNKNFVKAISTFVALSHEALKEPLLRATAKLFTIKAVICALANNDPTQASQILENMVLADSTFSSSREQDILASLISAFQDHNGDEFSQICASAEQVLFFEAWHIAILLISKSHIQVDNIKTSEIGNEELDLC